MPEFLDRLFGRPPKNQVKAQESTITGPTGKEWWVGAQLESKLDTSQGIPNQDVDVSGLQGQVQAIKEGGDNLAQIERNTQVVEAAGDSDSSESSGK